MENFSREELKKYCIRNGVKSTGNKMVLVENLNKVIHKPFVDITSEEAKNDSSSYYFCKKMDRIDKELRLCVANDDCKYNRGVCNIANELYFGLTGGIVNDDFKYVRELFKKIEISETLQRIEIEAMTQIQLRAFIQMFAVNKSVTSLWFCRMVDQNFETDLISFRSYCQLNKVFKVLMKSIAAHTTLKELRLNNCNWNKNNIIILENYLGGNPKLEYLDIRGCPISSIYLQSFSRVLSKNTYLKQMKLTSEYGHERRMVEACREIFKNNISLEEIIIMGHNHFPGLYELHQKRRNLLNVLLVISPREIKRIGSHSAFSKLPKDMSYLLCGILIG